MDSESDLEESLTSRKKYTKRPSHVLRVKFMERWPESLLPDNDDHRMWSVIDNTLVVKTWRSISLPNISPLLTNTSIENVTIEYNAEPHPGDIRILEQLSTLNCKFCLEFREHWAGHFSSNSIKRNEKTPDLIDPDTYVDSLLQPFFHNKSYTNIRVLTGHFSGNVIRNLPLFCSLNFLGLRANYEEYTILAEVIPFCNNLERIHLMPQWEYDSKQKIPAIRFKGMLHVYYWNLETTKAVKKLHRRWKKQQTPTCFNFCRFRRVSE